MAQLNAGASVPGAKENAGTKAGVSYDF